MIICMLFLNIDGKLKCVEFLCVYVLATLMC